MEKHKKFLLERIEQEVDAQLTNMADCGCEEELETETLGQLATDISYMTDLDSVDPEILKPMIADWLERNGFGR